MAEDRRIVIELKTSSSEEKEKNPDSTKSIEKRQKRIKEKTKALVKQAANVISSQAIYNIGRYTNLAEDYKSQVFITNVQTTVNKVKGLANTISSAYTMGTAIGGTAGTVLGTAMVGLSIVSDTINLLNQYREQSTNLLINDKQSQYAQSRLGLIDNGRGTQN